MTEKVSCKFLSYGDNEHLFDAVVEVVPRVGEFFIKDVDINDDWKQKFYIVRAVTTTLGNYVYVHLEQQDVDKEREKAEAIDRIMEDLKQKVEKHGIQANSEI